MLSTVVLPAPFGPMRLVTFPGSARSETSCAARTPPNAMPRCSTWSVARRAGASCISPAATTRALRRRAVRRVTRPVTPSGASQSTPRSSAPKKSSRYSASAASASGRSTTMVAPTSGPASDPAPPMITTSTKSSDCEKVKVDGVTKPESGANSAPARPAHRRQREQRPGRTRDERGDRSRGPEAPFRSHRQHGNRVGAERIEADMAEGDLPGQAEQHVEPDAGDRGQRERRHDVYVVAVGRGGEGDRRGEGDDEGERLHTFFSSARPKSPFGMRASATITSVNVRICVYAEPSSAVINDSTTPKMRPASITPQALVMPPRIATANAFRPNTVPMAECTLKTGAIMIAAAPAKLVETAYAAAMTSVTLMPTSRAASGFCTTASIALPFLE